VLRERVQRAVVAGEERAGPRRGEAHLGLRRVDVAQHERKGVAPRELPGGTECAGEERRVVADQRLAERHTGVLAVHGEGGEAETAARGVGRRDEPRRVARRLLDREPPESGDDGTGERRLREGNGEHRLDARFLMALEGQDRGGERLARLLEGERLVTRLPAGVAGDAQPVEVGVEAVVERRQL
jgi:hypothetical protein